MIFLQSVDWSGYVGTLPSLRRPARPLTSHHVTDVFPLRGMMVLGLCLEPGLPGLVVVGHITLPCCLWVPGSFSRPQDEETDCMLLFAASCLVDLARPCWFSRSGEVPDGVGQGKETLICYRRTQHSGLPLKEHRKNSESATKLNSVFADDSNTPPFSLPRGGFHRGLCTAAEKGPILHLLMQDHLHSAAPSSAESGGKGS